MARSGLASFSAAAVVLCFTLLSGCECDMFERRYGQAIFDSRSVKTLNVLFHVTHQRCWDTCNGASKCKASVHRMTDRKSGKGTCWHKSADKRTSKDPRTGKSLGSTFVVLSPCGSRSTGCSGSSRSPPPSPPPSSSRNSRNPRSSPSPAPAPTPSRSASRSNLAADVSLSPSPAAQSSPSPPSGTYIDKHWVHLPAFFKPKVLSMTCTSIGRGINAWNCEHKAWQAYGNSAIYAQSGGDGDQCIICRSGGSQDVGNVNVSGHDINRLWCKNKDFQAAWDKYSGSADKGPTYCSHVGDGDVFKWWVDNSGGRHGRSEYKGPGSL